jgi:hypothetical protein
VFVNRLCLPEIIAHSAEDSQPRQWEQGRALATDVDNGFWKQIERIWATDFGNRLNGFGQRILETD